MIKCAGLLGQLTVIVYATAEHILMVFGSFLYSFQFFVFIYVYWCPTRFPCQMIFLLFNINTKGVGRVANGSGTAYLSGAHQSPPPVLVGFVLLPPQFSVQCFVDHCQSFFFTISLSVVQFTVFNNPIIIVKLLLSRKNTISPMGFDPGTSCSINKRSIKYVK